MNYIHVVSCNVQELLAAGGNNIPGTIHEVIAHLATRLTRWDDRLYNFISFKTELYFV